MKIETHLYNDYAIDQLTQETKISKFEIPAGYINATQMCKASGKLWGHYSSLDSTKAYWEALSADIVIPISDLVISIKGGNDKRSQGTWVHPEIAIDLAQWVSIDFRIWANRELKRVIEQKPQPAIFTVEQICDLIHGSVAGLEISPHEELQMRLNAISILNPAYKDIADAAIESLKSQSAINTEKKSAKGSTFSSFGLLSPSEIAELLPPLAKRATWSAYAVNKLLIEQGFQVKNPEGNKPKYVLTEKGKPYAEIAFYPNQMRALRWHREIIEVIEF